MWSRTALLITYDENDGFFDHIVAPYPVAGASTVDMSLELYHAGHGYVDGPYGLGQRVPIIVVSPWSTGGWVCSEVFDHTSIVQFIEKRFGVHEPNISPWRRAICGDLTAAFDFGKARPATSRRATRVRAIPPCSADTYRAATGTRHNTLRASWSAALRTRSSQKMPISATRSRPPQDSAVNRFTCAGVGSGW